MFGLNPKSLFKMLQAAGIKIRFDLDKKAMIVKSDDGEQVHKFEEIERMVNGNG